MRGLRQGLLRFCGAVRLSSRRTMPAVLIVVLPAPKIRVLIMWPVPVFAVCSTPKTFEAYEKKIFSDPFIIFLPPANWMNDPNGLIQYEGTYHMFYQYNPAAPLPKNMHWGHASSKDLVHWQHEPLALTPTPGSPDEDGCWSGCAFVAEDLPAIVYTGRKGELERPCLAFSHDNLQTWEKYPGNPVIPDKPAGLDLTDFRDHKVWKENNKWYQLIAAGKRGEFGAVLLYESEDLKEWKFLKVLAPRG